ncbi:hypothetical protein Tco_0536883 [Tanacetum coccineum]
MFFRGSSCQLIPQLPILLFTLRHDHGVPLQDPYEEAPRQLLEQAPHSPEYVPDPMELEDHVPVYIPEPETSEDLHLTPSTYHPLLPSRTPPLLPIPLPTLSTSRRADILEADMPPQKRLLLIAPRPGCEVGESYAAAARQPGPTMARRVDCSSVDTVETRKDCAVVRAEIEVLRRERLTYEHEEYENRQALARYADDRATRHIMHIQALEAGARDDTLEDTGSSA